MKKLILLTAVIFSIIISFAFIHKSYTPLFDSSLVRVDSFPNNASVSNTSTLYHAKGGITGDLSTVITPNDTSGVATSYFGALTVLPSDKGMAHPPIYMSNGYYWIPFAIGTNINDSIFVRAPLHIDTTTYPGHRIIYIEHADGLVSGGIVTWSGTGLKFYVSPATYWIGGKYYESGLDSVTLAAADPTYSRYDLFVVDTTGHANKVTGQASMSPVVPQVSIGVELALTTAFTVNPGDTIPSNVALETIYNETAISPEWAISHVGYMIMDSLNTDNPYSLIHDIFVSKYAPLSGINPVITFQKASADTFHGDDIIQFALYLNGTLGNTRLYFDLLKSGSYATQYILLDNGYVNKNDTNHYVLVTIPLNALTWLNNGTFDAMRLGFLGVDTSGAKGLYLDKIILQHGINNIPSPTDYSNKLDSVYLRNDSLFQYVKGIETFRGKATGSGGGGSGIGQVIGINGIVNVNDSTVQADTLLMATRAWRQKGIDSVVSLINAKLNISDTAAMLAPYIKNITGLVTQGSNVTITGSGTSGSPYVINSTAGGSGTVTSISQDYGIIATPNPIVSTGTIKVDSAALSLKYLRIADTAQMLSNYQPKLNSGVGSNILISGNNISASDSTAYSSIAAAPYTFDSSYTVLKRRNSVNDSLVSPIPIDSLRRIAGSTQVEARKGGTWVNAFVDSTGSGGSGGIADSTYFWQKKGDYIPDTTKYIGSNDSIGIQIKTNSKRRMYFYPDSTGRTLFGDNTAKLQAIPFNMSFGGTYGNSTAGSTGNLKFDLYNDGTDTHRAGIGFSANSMEVRSGISQTMNFYTNNSTSFALKLGTDQSVNVGTGGLLMGATLGNSKIQLYNGLFGLGVGAGQFRFHVSSSSDKFSFFDAAAGTEFMTIKANGVIGLNNTSPDVTALLDMPSTTKIVLIPRMSKSQRLSITSGVKSGTTVGGSGYTNGTYPSTFTGGTGTGATFQASVAGGVISVSSITLAGQGYTIGDTLRTSSVPGGSGFYFIVTSYAGVLGSQTTNTTDSTADFYNGVEWTGFGSKITIPKTITATGTTGNQTIDKIQGTVNIAASGTSVTVTDAKVTSSSTVFCVIRTNDATAYIKNVVPSSGQFVVTLGAAATGEVSIGFLVIN